MKMRWESSGRDIEQPSQDLEQPKTSWDSLSEYDKQREMQEILDSMDIDIDLGVLEETRSKREKDKQRNHSEIDETPEPKRLEDYEDPVDKWIRENEQPRSESHYDADVGPHPEGTKVMGLGSSEPDPSGEREGNAERSLSEILREFGALMAEIDGGVENGESGGTTREERFGQAAIGAAAKQSESPVERGADNVHGPAEQEPSDEERMSAAMEYIRTNGTFPEGLNSEDKVKLSMECLYGGADWGRQIGVELTPKEIAARDERIREAMDYCFENGKLPDGLGDGVRSSLSYEYGLRYGELPDGLNEDERIKVGLSCRLNEAFYFNDLSSEERAKIEERVSEMWDYYAANGEMLPGLSYTERVGFAVEYYWSAGELPDGLDNDELSSAKSSAERAVAVAKESLNASGEMPSGLNERDRLDMATEYAIKNSAVPRGLDLIETENVVRLIMHGNGKMPEGLSAEDRLRFATEYAVENNKSLQGLSSEEEMSVARMVLFRKGVVPSFVDDAVRTSLASEYAAKKLSLPKGLSAEEELSLAKEIRMEGSGDEQKQKDKMLLSAAYDYCKEHGKLPDGLEPQTRLDASWRYYKDTKRVPSNLGWGGMVTIIKRIGAEEGDLPRNLGENARLALAAELNIDYGVGNTQKLPFVSLFGPRKWNESTQFLRSKQESCLQTGEMPTGIGPKTRMKVACEYCSKKRILPSGLREGERGAVLKYCFDNGISLARLSDEDRKLMAQWRNGA